MKFSLKNMVLVRQGMDALEAIMRVGGVPRTARLERVTGGHNKLIFTMHDGSEWTATVALEKTK